MIPDPVAGTDCSVQSVYWKCFTGREESSLVSTILNSLHTDIQQHIIKTAASYQEWGVDLRV